MRIVSARRLFPSVLFLSALPLLLQPAFSSPPPPANPHEYFRQPAQCLRCHLNTDSKPDPGRFSTSSVDICLECHLAEELGRTHPRKVHPGSKFRDVKIPPEFRLGDGEHIVCLTCHSAHGPYVSNIRSFAGQRPMNVEGADATPYYKTFFLRRSNPAGEGFEALCSGCHRTP